MDIRVKPCKPGGSGQSRVVSPLHVKIREQDGRPLMVTVACRGPFFTNAVTSISRRRRFAAS